PRRSGVIPSPLSADPKVRLASWDGQPPVRSRRERSPQMPQHDLQLAAAVRDGIARAVAVIGLAAVALIHLLDADDTFVSTPYRGWLYVGLIVGSLATGAALLRRSDTRAWAGALLLPLGALAAFAWSRTIGLPGGADDIGNWWEPLGLASVFVEGALVALSGAVLSARPSLAETSRPRRAMPVGAR